MACNCIEAIDAQLRPDNLSLCVTHTINLATYEKGGVYPSLSTEPLTTGKPRPRRKTILPTFCPFCGTKYREDKKDSA